MWASSKTSDRFTTPLACALSLGLALPNAQADCGQPAPPYSANDPFQDAGEVTNSPDLQARAHGSHARTSACKRTGVIFSVRRTSTGPVYPWRFPTHWQSDDFETDAQTSGDDRISVGVANSDAFALRFSARERENAAENGLPFDLSEKAVATTSSADTPNRLFQQPDFSARVKLLDAGEQRLSVDWGKNAERTEHGLTLAIDNAHPSSERLRLQGKAIRTVDGDRLYMLGLRSERMNRKNLSALSFGIGDTGQGGLGARAMWSRKSHATGNWTELSTAAGDDGVHVLIRMHRRF